MIIGVGDGGGGGDVPSSYKNWGKYYLVYCLYVELDGTKESPVQLNCDSPARVKD